VELPIPSALHLILIFPKSHDCADNVNQYDEFVVEAKRRFEQDFWARPRFTFPYSVSLFHAVTSNTFYFNNIASWGRPAMSYEYQSENPLRRALTAAIDRWRSSVSAKGITPFVLFVPLAAGDRGVSTQYVKCKRRPDLCL
jgi:hypothetical protein